MVVYSYGGGEILYNIFQGVAKLHNAGFLKQLFYIGGIAGLMLMIIKLFYSNASPIELIRKWFLPVLLGLSLLILPKTSVMVKDIITGTEKAVGNVPYGLAIMARLSSHVGHLITRGIEQAMHVPDNLQYNKTGHVFGAENLMDIGNFRWTDPVTEENMRNFVVNCVAYDLLLGRYSLKDLKYRPKLWPFIKEKTSKNRGIYWMPADTQDSPQREPKYCSCREADGRLDTCFKEEITLKKRDPKFAKYLPQAFQALTKLSRSADEIIMQQLMHHSYVDGLENKSVALGLGHNFAASRAYMQQQSTMQIAGSLAGKSIVIIRAIFEALILVSFIFIVPMMALPMGISYFGKWAEMVIWVNLWPPVYAVLNFILQASAQAKAKVIVDLYDGASEKGLNLAMATPLATLYNDMVAYAGWASTFVPVLAYMILKGGMASFVHIAGNMMNASQSAAGAAAQELTTGNYSFGNVSRGVMNSNISNMNQFRDAPSMQSGFFHVSTGSSDVTYGSDGSAVYRQQVSSLPINFSMSQLISSNLNRQASESMQLAHTEGVNFATSMDMVTRELISLDQHMGSSSSASISKSHGMDESTQKSIHSMALLQKVTKYEKEGKSL